MHSYDRVNHMVFSISVICSSQKSLLPYNTFLLVITSLLMHACIRWPTRSDFSVVLQLEVRIEHFLSKMLETRSVWDFFFFAFIILAYSVIYLKDGTQV